MATLQISESDLMGFTESVCSMFLGLSVGESGNGVDESLLDDQALTSCVLIAGEAWKGAVTVQLSGPLSRTVAAGMFGMGTEELGDEEIVDAVGEVANMIGGNVKGLAEGSTTLSLPAVAQGVQHKLLVPGAAQLNAIICNCEGQPMIVRVLEQRD